MEYTRESFRRIERESEALDRKIAWYEKFVHESTTLEDFEKRNAELEELIEQRYQMGIRLFKVRTEVSRHDFYMLCSKSGKCDAE